MAPTTPAPEPITVSDVTQEASLAAYLPVIQAEGIAAMTFIPLVSVNQVIGKFMLYYGEPHVHAAEELQVANLIAAQIAFAVERTRTQSFARRREEGLRFALDAANMGTWDWDVRRKPYTGRTILNACTACPQGRSTAPSRATNERSIQTTVGACSPPSRTRSRQVPFMTWSIRIVAPDGSIRWVEGKGRVESDERGRPVRIAGVCVNVTSRKQAELARVDALEHASRISQRLAEIVESSGDAIVSKDLDGIVTSWNDAAERLFGFSALEMIGRPILAIIPPDRIAEESMVLERIRPGETVAMETMRQRRDGSQVAI